MKIEDFDSLIDSIVYTEDYNSYFKSIVKNGLNNRESLFNDGEFIFSFYNQKIKNIEKLTNFELLKIALQNEFIGLNYLVSFSKITDKEILWHYLSVFVGDNNIPNIRQNLTNEIYDNPNYIFDIENSNSFFKESNFSIVCLEFEKNTKSLGCVKKDKLEQLKQSATKLDILFKVEEKNVG